MKIIRIDPIIADLPLLRPFKMSGVEISVSENVFARIETDTGLVGWGEAQAAHGRWLDWHNTPCSTRCRGDA